MRQKKLNYYVLTGLESVSLGEAVLLHPGCTWGNLTKRAHPVERDGLGKIESEWKRRERMLWISQPTAYCTASD